MPKSKVRSPWKLFTEPNAAVHAHALLFGLWVALTVPSVLWWHDSILWVIFLSLYAIWITHLSALQAALADRRIKDQVEDGTDERGGPCQ